MLAPQFTLRRLLALVTASGVVCLVLAAAVRGQLWAVGVLIALVALVVTILVHAAVFLITRAAVKSLDYTKRRKSIG